MVLIDESAVIEEALRIIGKGSVRLAVDSVGGDATATLVQLLSDRGVPVSHSAATGRPMAINTLFLIGKHLTVKGFFLGDFDHGRRFCRRRSKPLRSLAPVRCASPSPRCIRCRKSRKPSLICSKAVRS